MGILHCHTVAALLLLLTFGLLETKLFAQSDTDFQVWNETTLVFPVIKQKDEKGKEFDRLSLLIFGTLRLGQNRLYPTDGRLGAGFDFKINKYLNFTPTYLYRRAEPVNNRPEYEHRVRFDLTVGDKWEHFSIKDRSRVEYRIRNSRANSVRYRNKFTFTVPVNSDGKEVFAPFISDEPYYDFHEKEWTTNDFSVGIGRKLTKNTSAEFFYLRRDVTNGAIRHINAIGVNLKIRID